MVEIDVQTRWMPHEGNTKFYEVIQFHNEAAGRFVVVRRWGKLVGKLGGGEVKIETFDTRRRCLEAAERIASDKAGRGYERTHEVFGLHSLNGFVVSDADLADTIAAHYMNSDAFHHIMASLGFEVAGSRVVDNFAIEETPMAEHEHEPARDADWGSW